MPKSIHRAEYLVLCELLRDVRLQAGLTQVALAKKLKRPQTFVSTVERGLVRQDFLQLRDWCVRCGTDLQALSAEFEVRLKEAKKGARRAKAAAVRE
ncbi:MAG: helix-turn-helix transcriptional regulator [Rhodanobacteraceae bacterium]|nr:helix-turn-helix transcriptional regulator [Rhodanobacteraceae bacterium]